MISRPNYPCTEGWTEASITNFLMIHFNLLIHCVILIWGTLKFNGLVDMYKSIGSEVSSYTNMLISPIPPARNNL
jgi:hypothetical protein